MHCVREELSVQPRNQVTDLSCPSCRVMEGQPCLELVKVIPLMWGVFKQKEFTQGKEARQNMRLQDKNQGIGSKDHTENSLLKGRVSFSP